ncbi:MAG: NnrS family protein [Gammaproteobacteria bacterium]
MTRTRAARGHARSNTVQALAQKICFTAAALYAALLVPLALDGAPALFAAWAPPVGHARELLGGYALAVVTGYLVGRPAPGQLVALCVSWLLARLGWLLDPGGAWAVASQALFALVFTASLAPKFIGRGRRWRNLAIAPLLALMAAASVALDGALGLLPAARDVMLLALAALLAFMGGRLLAPALATQLERDGTPPQARLQPRLEGTVMALLALAMVLAASGLAPWLAGACTMAAGATVALRLARWRVWRCRGRGDLWCLAAGHAWLAFGLLAYGHALGGASASAPGAHLLTVGALGTFSFNVMLRARLQRLRRDPARAALLPAGTLLIALATLARGIAPALDAAPAQALMALAAAAWSLAFIALARRLLRA